jgi:tetratricopeptide (TPR) repeat protein
VTKTLTATASAEKNVTKIASIHADVEDFCFVWTFETLSEKEFESTEEVLASARFTESMLGAPSAKDRVEAAGELLKKHPECGLPYLVFARDGAIAEREENYRRAIDLLSVEAEKARGYEEAIETVDTESDDDDDDNKQNEKFQSLLDWYDEVPYSFEVEGVAFVTAELARFLWQEGRHDDAIACIVPVLTRLEDEASYLQAIVASYLIQANKEEQASSLLDQMPLPFPEWYYSKTLLLFRKHGDSSISRSTLQRALTANKLMAKVILTGHATDSTGSSANEFEENSFDESELSGNDSLLVSDAATGWHTTPGAMEWLAGLIDRIDPLSGTARLTDPQIKSRAKLWQTHFEIADVQIERDNYKEAKKNARMAFKEIRKVGFLNYALYQSLDQLIDIAEEYDGAKGEIIQYLDELLLQRESIENKAEATYIIAKVAESYQKLQMHEHSMKLLEKEIPVIEHLLEINESTVCLDNLAMALFCQGCNFRELERWQEAKSATERSAELQESYLGKDHPDLLANLGLVSLCLEKLGELEKAKGIKVRMKAIQLAFYGEEFEDPEA